MLFLSRLRGGLREFIVIPTLRNFLSRLRGGLLTSASTSREP